MNKLITSLLFIIAILLSGCVGGPDDVIGLPSTDLYNTKIAKGWIEFESGNYQNAITVFREASEIDPMLPDSYLGLGWSYAMLDQMTDSLSNLKLAITKNPDSPDGYAARAFVYLAQNEYSVAILDADRAISLGGEEYVFSQIPEVQTRNLRLLIAECYYAIGQYSAAQAQVDILEPDNNLDPNSRDYKRDLLTEIESLKLVGPTLASLNN